MADKTQNITINYKFNTAEVDRAGATLNRANQASNQLEQSAKKAGSAISQEFQKSNKTILDMQTALTRLKSVIEVTSNPAKLRQLTNEYKNLKVQLDAATKSAFGLDSALKNQGATANSLSSTFGKLYGAAQAVFGAAIVRQVAAVTLEMAKLAGNAEGIERAFQRAFPDSVGILNRMREATKGTVDDVTLMQRTLQATNLGVSVEQLPQLFEFAATRAQQTGESVDYLVDSIVRGIGRKSPLILDNLGLSATRLKEKFDGAALASQSVADVTKAVAEIAGEEMEKMGGFIETSATRVDQLNTAWTKLKTNFASRIDSSGIINFFRDAFNGAAEFLRTEKEIYEETVKQRASTEVASLKEHQLSQDRVKNQEDLINKIQDEIRERFRLIEAGRVEYEILKQKFQAHNDTGNATGKQVNDAIEMRKQIMEQGKNLKANVDFYKETIRLLKAYQDELNKPPEEVESSGIIERKKKEIEELQKQIEKTNNILDLGPTRLTKSGEIIQGRLIAKLEIAQAELADLQRGFLDFKAIEFETEIKNAAQALSNISGVLARVDADIRDGLQGTKPPTPPTYTPDTWQKIKDDFVENWREITSSAIDIQADQLKSMTEAEVNSAKARLSQTQEYYSMQQSLAGDNERAKEQLRIREERETTKLRNDIARKEKRARRSQVYIDIAAGIAKAFATYPWPYSLIPAAFVTAQGAGQLAIINRQPENFAEGVINLKGPGTEKSDSIPANLSRGESVMTAWETRHAGDVLREIRAKKMDNNRLRELKQGRAPVQSTVFNDQNIIKAIKDQKNPDVVKIANIAYEVKESTKDYKKRIRSSSMGI
jgi:hypothetical protein